MEALVKDLINDFVDETENEFFESVYDWYYETLADAFQDEVEGHCKIVIFGYERAMSVHELYDDNRFYAVQTWRDYVSRSLEEGFRDWANKVILGSIETFAAEFRQWLATQDSEDAANVAVALMAGDIDLTEAIIDWLYDRLSNEDWVYPV